MEMNTVERATKTEMDTRTEFKKKEWASSVGLWSPWAHLHMVRMLQFMSNINQPSFPTPFHSVLVSISVFMALSTVFHSINSPDNSLFSHYILPVLTLPYCPFNYISLYASLLQLRYNPQWLTGLKTPVN